MAIIIIAILALGGWYVFSGPDSDETMTESESIVEKEGGEMMEENGGTMMDEEEEMTEGNSTTKKGTYESYSAEKLALAEGDGRAILFFRATWCPTCRALDADIRANSEKIPAGVTILDINYDNSTALKQKYGVTYQHILVEVDEKGNLLQKWSNSPTLSDVLSHL